MLSTVVRTGTALAIALAVALGLSVLGCCGGEDGSTSMKVYENADFYGADGSFDAERAKAAYYELMEHHGYPIPEMLKGDDFWTLDFGLGSFTEVGMAGVFWINHEEHDYMGHEIFLLPGQMIPEHWHEPTEKARAKVEAWHLRHGSVTLVGEGEPTPGLEIPPSHRDIAVARNAYVLKPGETRPLAAPLQKHWMVAGPEGAIVSEYACAHDMAGLRFTHPEITLD